ncbi:MAG: MoaD/ThiS family protein [Candidatus Hermodarchaeota archaeon]|nr:MoaD/ThiS family protein [Candidatus Hermodarchaeota archaeon]
MESEIDYTDMALSNGFSEIRLTKSKTVRELLKELGLLHRHFVVLVDGKRVSLEDAIEEGQRVIVLPIIAGG